MDFEVRITKLVHPNKIKTMSRGRDYVKNGETIHLMSKPGYEVSGWLPSLLMCDSDMEVSKKPSDLGIRVRAELDLYRPRSEG